MIRASSQQSHGHCRRDYMIIACDNLIIVSNSCVFKMLVEFQIAAA